MALAPDTVEADAPTRRSRRIHNVGAWLGATIITAWIAAAITIPAWRPFHPTTDQDVYNRLAAPDGTHFFGTDSLGRDEFTRVIYGARISLPVALIAVVTAVLVGCLIGAIAGFGGKWVDEILMRICDVFLAFPAMVLALAIAAALGRSTSNVVIAIAAVTWPEYARLMRGQVLAIRDNLHVKAAESVGCSPLRVFFKHVLPYATPPIVVKATVDLGMAILLTAGLSFVGVGAQPPTPEWGAMIADASQHMAEWWLSVFPGVAILSIVISVNFIGDSLRDHFDPHVRAQRVRSSRLTMSKLLLGGRTRKAVDER